MVGYVVLLISFPLQMSSWTEPRGIGDVPGLIDAFIALLVPASYDAVTAATPLDLFRQNEGMMFGDLMAARPEMMGTIAGVGWDWVNLAFLFGGIWLLRAASFHLACAGWHARSARLLRHDRIRRRQLYWRRLDAVPSILWRHYVRRLLYHN